MRTFIGGLILGMIIGATVIITITVLAVDAGELNSSASPRSWKYCYSIWEVVTRQQKEIDRLIEEIEIYKKLP